MDVAMIVILMLPNASGSAVHSLHSQYSQMSIERKVAFNQNGGNLGRWGTQRRPKTACKDTAWP